MTETTGVEAVGEALETLTGGDPALMQAAMLYATAYENSPAAVIGMLCVTQGIILQRVTEMHEVVMPAMDRIKPIVDDPSVILASLPPTLRAMLGM